MKVTSKCLVVALSALFAATPVAPVGAVPMPTVQLQAQNGQTDIQPVREERRNWHKRYRERHWRGHRNWDQRVHRRWDRHDRRGWHRGHRGYRYARPGYRYHNGFWFPFAAFGAGAMFGGMMVPQRRYYASGSAHVRWCANRYRSYRAYDNTFQPYNGPRRQCYSPYR